MTERILKMPRLGETMDEGKVVGWLIAPGDNFKRGDSILEIETDKTIAEFPALGDGRLDEILVSIGDTVEVGIALARIDIGDGPDWTSDGEEDLPVAEAAVASTMEQTADSLAETDLVMPRLGETMEEGRVTRWLKAPGDSFARGEAILEIETDKTVAEFPALTEGRLVAILRADGEMVTVGDPIARIEVAAHAVADTDAKPTATASDRGVDTAPASALVATACPNRSRRATPLARRLARRHGLDITALAGSGRRGRIEKSDVLAAVEGSVTPVETAVSADVQFANLQRGRMAYLDTGPVAGLPILLLHGFSGDRTTWASIVAGLRRAGRRVIVPDLPGHGLTTIAATVPTDLSADLPAFLDALGIQKVDIVAHSLGAVAALGLASAAPARAGSLSLIAPAGLGSEIDGHFVHGMANVRTPGEAAHLLRRLSVSSIDLSEPALDALADRLSKGRLVALAEAVAGPSGQKVDTLSGIERLSATIPVCVLVGLEDRIIPWKHIVRLPPRVAVHILSRSGHMPQWDQTKDVLDILLS